MTERMLGAATKELNMAAPTMPDVIRRGRIAWLTHPPAGRATISSESHAFGALPVSLPERDPVPNEAAPGELLALTQGTFLAAAIAEGLVTAGFPANEIVVDAECTFAGARNERGLAAVAMHVIGRVPGMDTDAFRDEVEKAWPKALRSAGMREDRAVKLHAELASS